MKDGLNWEIVSINLTRLGSESNMKTEHIRWEDRVGKGLET